MITASVVAIKLVSFSYTEDYEPTEGTNVRYKVDTLHRPHIEAKNLDVLINVEYFAEDVDKVVLNASCLTTFHVPNATPKVYEEDGRESLTVSNAEGKRITQEAVSHARALIAVHTASTPFSTSHIALTEILTREEAEAQGLLSDKKDSKS